MTQGSPTRAIRVLAADDSNTMRSLLKILFQLHAEDTASSLPRMELCGSVADGAACLEAVAQLKPDVLLLDFEMPGLHGLGVLTRLKTEAPRLPVIMCSAYTERGAQATLDALSLGAKDYVMKPSQQRDVASAIDQLAEQLLPKIAALASPQHIVPLALRKIGAPRATIAPTGSPWRITSAAAATACPIATPAQRVNCSPEIAHSCVDRYDRTGTSVCTLATAPRILEPLLQRGEPHRVEIVVIGVSTGGPSALESILPMLPGDLAVPILIVQHMPKLFTGALAERLDRLCALPVAEAREGDRIGGRGIWIAPGDEHMEVVRAGGQRGPGVLRLHHGAALNSCRPSVDHLFRSASLAYGAGVLGIMMTGMGGDGFAGSVAVHKAGGTVIAQDEATSAVWGMPGRVSRAGIAAATLPLREIARDLVQRVSATDTVDKTGRRHGLL